MKLIKRQAYLDFLRRHQHTPVIKVVSGVRRSGKSTLFALYKEELMNEGIQAEQIISLNFEDLRYEHLQDYHALYDYIMERIVPDSDMYIFLDEIQHVPQFEKVVDSLFIQDKLHIYLTGSNAYFLSSEISTLLSGRYVQMEMLPLSYQEFSEAHVDEGLSPETLYDKYLQESAFPGVLHLGNDEQTIREYLRGLLNTVLLKDVVDRLNISNVKVLEDILRYILANIGSLINPTKIANTLVSMGRKVDNKTVEKYITGLKEALLIYEAPRFDVRGKELLRSNAKYYVVDTAFRHFLLAPNQRDRGHLLENVVYLELRRRGYDVYVGHLAKGEIDFVASKGGKIEYYQVSQTVLDDAVLDRELSPFLQVEDNYPKYLLTMDHIYRAADHAGITQYNVFDWLLGEKV